MLDESQLLALFEPAFRNNKTAHTPNPTQWPGQQEDPLSAANLHTYMDPSAVMARKRTELASNAPTSTTAPHWYADARISLIMRTFSDAQRQSTNSQESPDAGSTSPAATICQEFEASILQGPTGRGATVSLVRNAIMNAVAEMLFVDVEGIDPGKSVADLGVDSLIAAELENWFLLGPRANISLLDLLDPGESISARAEGIVDRLWRGRCRLEYL